MKISAIVAFAKKNIIGINGKLPWYIPEDLKNFKNITIGKPVIMGRKTFDSLKKPLPGRTNIVITRNSNFIQNKVVTVNSMQQAIQKGKEQIETNSAHNNEVIIIGGANIYEQSIHLCQRIYLTKIDLLTNGDTFFPKIDWKKWKETSRIKKQTNTQPIIEYSFIILDKK